MTNHEFRQGMKSQNVALLCAEGVRLVFMSGHARTFITAHVGISSVKMATDCFASKQTNAEVHSK